MTTLSRQQQNEAEALAVIAWAILDAESRDDRRGAGSLVPVFASSWNAWGSSVRAVFGDAPRSLDVTAMWGAGHTSALQLAIAVGMQNSTMSTAAIDASLDALDGMPGGVVPNSFRGVWFETSFATAERAKPLYQQAAQAMQRGGAGAVSELSGAIAVGASAVRPTVPTQQPVIPTQPSAPSSAFELPTPINEQEEITIIGEGAGARSPFPVVPVLVGGVLIVGLGGLAAYGSTHGWFR